MCTEYNKLVALMDIFKESIDKQSRMLDYLEMEIDKRKIEIESLKKLLEL